MRKMLLLLSILIMASAIDHRAFAAATQTEKYTGYEVDGRTSASVIAAKRSHTISKQDEMGWTVFSGIFVIGAIVFLAGAKPKK